MSVLDELYLAIKNSNSGASYSVPEIYPHYIHYTRFLIEDKLKIKLTLEQVFAYMFSEGLLPDEYYVSTNYLVKWHKKTEPWVERIKTTRAIKKLSSLSNPQKLN